MNIDMRAWNGRSIHPFVVASDQLAGAARLASSFLITPAQVDPLMLLTRPPHHAVCGLPVFIRAEMSE